MQAAGAKAQARRGSGACSSSSSGSVREHRPRLLPPARAFSLEPAAGGPKREYSQAAVAVGSDAGTDLRVQAPGGARHVERRAAQRCAALRRAQRGGSDPARCLAPPGLCCRRAGAALGGQHSDPCFTPNPAVAPRHAALSQKGKQVFLTALLGEEVWDDTATWIDGAQARPNVQYVLSSGSRLSFGGCEDGSSFTISFEEPSG